MWDFSVVDNGIISEVSLFLMKTSTEAFAASQEKWHLLGADDDLQWIVLFYASAPVRTGVSHRQKGHCLATELTSATRWE